jgi:hypothetical protein
LDERRTRFDLGEGRLGTFDPANTNQRKLAIDALVALRQHGGGQGEERTTGKSAGLAATSGTVQVGGPCGRRVGYDQTVDRALAGDANGAVEFGQRKIRRDFQKQRPPDAGHLIAAIDKAGQEIVEGCRLVQIAQAGRVRRGNINGEIAGNIGKAAQPRDIIGDPIGRIAIGANIDPDDAGGRRMPAQALMHARLTFVIEAEPVDQPRILAEAKNPRLRIAVLRARRHGAHLGKTQPATEQGVDHFGVLVESGRQPERIGKGQTERIDPQAGIGGARTVLRQELESGYRKPVSPFWLQAAQQRQA